MRPPDTTRAFFGGVGIFRLARVLWSPPIKCRLSIFAAQSWPVTSSYGRRHPLQ
jgi:hypothetical protein